MKDRIKKLRKSLRLSRDDFGKSLGVSRDVIANIELDRLARPEQKEPLVRLICETFNVDYVWLTTGDGEMFVESDDTNISAVATEFQLDTLSKVILSAYVKMEADKRTIFNDFVKEIADTVMQENAEKARIKVGDAILGSRAPESVKLDLSGKTAAIFIEAFPYIGVGNVSESEMRETTTDDEERSALHAKLDEEFTKEKRQETKVSFAKESDVG